MESNLVLGIVEYLVIHADIHKWVGPFGMEHRIYSNNGHVKMCMKVYSSR